MGIAFGRSELISCTHGSRSKNKKVLKVPSLLHTPVRSILECDHSSQDGVPGFRCELCWMLHLRPKGSCFKVTRLTAGVLHIIPGYGLPPHLLLHYSLNPGALNGLWHQRLPVAILLTMPLTTVSFDWPWLAGLSSGLSHHFPPKNLDVEMLGIEVVGPPLHTLPLRFRVAWQSVPLLFPQPAGREAGAFVAYGSAASS